MSSGSAWRRISHSVLPRSMVERIAAAAAYRQRRANEAKLPTAERDFENAYDAYWATGIVPPDAEQLLHLATWASGGNIAMARARERGTPFKRDRFSDLTDLLLSDLDPVAAATGVEEEGCYVVPTRLPSGVVDEIRGVLDAGPAQPRGDGLGHRPPGVPDPTAPTWWMDPADTMQSVSVRRLLTERRLAEVAGNYLTVDPMIMSIVLWKSFASARPDKNSAQHFHFDNDRAAFVKMFIYLTDVDRANGPHTYVRRSHRAKPRELLHGQRLSDEAVARFFPREKWMEITGERGTVVFADTAGFHKGGHVREGTRGMFQINLASDRFGVAEPPIGGVAAAPADLSHVLERLPRFYSQLFPPDHVVP